MYVTYDITLTVEVPADPDGWVSRETLDHVETALAAIIEYSTARESIETGLDNAVNGVCIDEFRLIGRCNLDDRC
jgi:hypothetical protein